jgi:ABC-type uncharacterized transport system ATPase subunit
MNDAPALVCRVAVALDDVTLDLPAHSIVGFVGPDGVGKSSLLALLSGARRIQTGRIEVLGGDMADARHRAADLRAVAPDFAIVAGLGAAFFAAALATFRRMMTIESAGK